MATKICAALPLLVLAFALPGQDKRLIDSLYGRFHASHDAAERLEFFYQIAVEMNASGNPEVGFRQADSLDLLANTARSEKGHACAESIRGLSFDNKGEYAAALPIFHRQLAICRKLSDLEGQAKALNSIGGAWQNMNVDDSAIVYLSRSLDLKERLGNLNDVAAGLGNIANIYSDEHAYDKAIELLQRALDIRRKLGEEKRTMFTFNNLAVAYGLKGDFEKSIAAADSAIRIALKYGNKMAAGVVCGGMGHVLNEQKKFEESIRWCERSLGYLEGSKMEAKTVFPLCNMATALIGLGQFAKGLEVNQRGWEIMQRLHLAEPIDPYHENFANAYAGLGDFKNAFRWHKIYFARIDSVTEKDNLSKVANIEAKYDLEKKERQLGDERAENFRQKTWLWTLAGLLVAALVLGWLFYNRFRLRKKAELDAAIIQEQKLGLNAVIEAQESERRRIAKDLHDGIAQELVALKMGFDVLGRRVGKVAPDEAPKVSELAEQLNSTCDEVRTIAHAMSPPSLENQGLAPSLELLVRQTLQHAGIAAELDTQNLPKNLDKKTEVGLYRIAQELLQNIVKHAHAAKVKIELRATGPNLELRVEDDGVGYDFEVARRRGSMGLLNILSRASALGGSFLTENALPHGTVALVRIPV